MKAQKKPVIIDYLPFEGDWYKIAEWVTMDFCDNFDEWFILGERGRLYVQTLEGTSYQITEDDVIVRGVDHEYYPCKKSIFYKTHDIL